MARGSGHVPAPSAGARSRCRTKFAQLGVDADRDGPRHDLHGLAPGETALPAQSRRGTSGGARVASVRRQFRRARRAWFIRQLPQQFGAGGRGRESWLAVGLAPEDRDRIRRGAKRRRLEDGPPPRLQVPSVDVDLAPRFLHARILRLDSLYSRNMREH